ncbi:MAG: hypothetical protein RL226_2290, partial [Bacteroidota bacterium]
MQAGYFGTLAPNERISVMEKAIRFMAPVNAQTSDLLFKVID